MAATLTAVAHGECGHVPEMWAIAAEARAQAERLHLPYGLVVLDTLELPWLVMAGRFDEGEERSTTWPGSPGRCRCRRPRTRSPAP